MSLDKLVVIVHNQSMRRGIDSSPSVNSSSFGLLGGAVLAEDVLLAAGVALQIDQAGSSVSPLPGRDGALAATRHCLRGRMLLFGGRFAEALAKLQETFWLTQRADADRCLGHCETRGASWPGFVSSRRDGGRPVSFSIGLSLVVLAQHWRSEVASLSDAVSQSSSSKRELLQCTAVLW